MQIAYCRKHFPEVELRYYGSIEKCLTEVMAGRADGTIVNALRTELILILNRGLRTIGSSFGIESSYKYMESFYTYHLRDFFLENIAILLTILLLVVGGIILLLAVNLHRKAVQVSEKELQ